MPNQLVPTEHAEAVALMGWAYRTKLRPIDAVQPGACVADYLVAIPNGGARHIVTAAKLRAEGVKPGVSDYFLAVPVSGRHGLWVELKRRKGGQLSEPQKHWLLQMRAVGYAAECARGADEAIEIIKDYLSLGRNDTTD